MTFGCINTIPIKDKEFVFFSLTMVKDLTCQFNVGFFLHFFEHMEFSRLLTKMDKLTSHFLNLSISILYLYVVFWQKHKMKSKCCFQKMLFHICFV